VTPQTDPAALRWAHGRLEDRPSLLCAGLGRGWWWPRCPAVADARRVWVISGGEAHVLPLAEVEQVGRDERGIVAVSGRRWARLGAGLTLGETGRERVVPGGEARIWRDEEFVYRQEGGRTRAVEVLAPGERLAVGPHGALAAGMDAWTRAGSPGRTPRPLPRPLGQQPLRWSSDGGRVAGLDADGQAVVVDLASGRLREVRGVPASSDTFLVGDALMRGRHEVYGPVTEATCARYGDWLAGPAGALWSLSDGRRRSPRGSVWLGVTVGTPSGFVTVDWATGRGHRLGWDGERVEPFVVPLAEDDLVEAGVWEDGAVHLQTAMGVRWRLVGGELARGDREVEGVEAGEVVESPVGEVEVSGTVRVGGRRWAWSDDGWLWAWKEED
jgi:hypothetical protein